MNNDELAKMMKPLTDVQGLDGFRIFSAFDRALMIANFLLLVFFCFLVFKLVKSLTAWLDAKTAVELEKINGKKMDTEPNPPPSRAEALITLAENEARYRPGK